MLASNCGYGVCCSSAAGGKLNPLELVGKAAGGPASRKREALKVDGMEKLTDCEGKNIENGTTLEGPERGSSWAAVADGRRNATEDETHLRCIRRRMAGRGWLFPKVPIRFFVSLSNLVIATLAGGAGRGWITTTPSTCFALYRLPFQI